jgi:hypothetical protein
MSRFGCQKKLAGTTHRPRQIVARDLDSTFPRTVLAMEATLKSFSHFSHTSTLYSQRPLIGHYPTKYSPILFVALADHHWYV